MKIFKKLNIKKIFKSLKTGVLSTNIFFFLFTAFFSTLALAAALTLTHKENRIPNSAPGCFSSKLEQINQTTSVQSYFTELKHDRTENLRDIVWSDDGTMVFSINNNMDKSPSSGYMGDLDLSMNKVATPFELNTVKTDTTDNIPHTCDDIDGFDVDHPEFLAQGLSFFSTAYRSIHVAKGGRIFYILNSTGDVYRYDLSTPFDFKTAKYIHQIDLSTSTKVTGFSLSRDGTRMYSVDQGEDADTPVVATFSLSPAFDITSATEIHSVNLFTIGVEDVANFQAARDIEFSDDGSQMFVSFFNKNHTNSIEQFSLGKPFDVSTATHLGGHDFLYRVSPGGALRDADEAKSYPAGHGIIWGFSFSSDGMKLFISQADDGQTVDNIYQFDLDCPYGIVSCVSNASASVNAQVELAKQNISINVDTIFKRFEWIKRNRDQEDLTSHNININYPNPILKSLASKLEPSLKNNLVSLVSNTQKNDEKKKSKWSSWSLLDLSIGDYQETLVDKAKGIKTKGITFGSDRKIGDNKFFGLALRYGDSASNIRRSSQKVDLESLTLNIYGTVPTNNNRYINAVLGLSALRFDNKYLGKISGERNGRQAFASINYRTKKTYGKFNITPTGKLTYGVTELSEFTDFISKASDRPATDIRFHDDTFVSGEFTGGVLFEMEKIERDGVTFQPMGGIEIIYDLADDNAYKYSYAGSTVVNEETINSYSNKKLKTNIGLEYILENGFTILFDYKYIKSLDNCESCLHSAVSQNFNNKTFIIKFSKSKEENNQFALDFDPINNNNTKVSYLKQIGNFNLKLNSNYSLFSKIPDYGANIEISGTF